MIDFVNKRLEQRAEVYFTNNFKHRNLYQVFVRQYNSNSERTMGGEDFANNFKEVMKPTISTNKYYKDYKLKLERELQKFNGKVTVGEGAETNSEATTLTKNTKKSGS